MASTSEPKKYKVIGTRPIRHDGADKVTGRAIYGSDLQLPGTVHGKIVRSPHAHALIKSIDTSAAQKVPGVVAVVTAADLPNLQNKIADLGEGAVNLAHLAPMCWRTRRRCTKATPSRPWRPPARTSPKRRPS